MRHQLKIPVVIGLHGRGDIHFFLASNDWPVAHADYSLG
jgi:hypothetical protein